MNIGKMNTATGALILLLVAMGGFFLGYTLDPLLTDGFYKMSYARLLFRGAHSHGMLFGLFNLVIGLAMHRLALPDKKKRALSVLGIVSLLLPLALLLRGLTHPSKVFLPLGAVGGFAFVAACVLVLMGALKQGVQEPG